MQRALPDLPTREALLGNSWFDYENWQSLIILSGLSGGQLGLNIFNPKRAAHKRLMYPSRPGNSRLSSAEK